MALALPADGLPARGIACGVSSRNHLYAPAPISRELFDSLRARRPSGGVYHTCHGPHSSQKSACFIRCRAPISILVHTVVVSATVNPLRCII